MIVLIIVIIIIAALIISSQNKTIANQGISTKHLSEKVAQYKAQVDQYENLIEQLNDEISKRKESEKNAAEKIDILERRCSQRWAEIQALEHEPCVIDLRKRQKEERQEKLRQEKELQRQRDEELRKEKEQQKKLQQIEQWRLEKGSWGIDHGTVDWSAIKP